MSVFATRLRELRGAESQASFAAAVGINRVQLAKYESGQNAPSIEALAKICTAHAVSADWLLGLKDQGTTVNAGAGAAVAIGPHARASVRGASAAPGEYPLCSKCPYKKKLQKFQALLSQK